MIPRVCAKDGFALELDTETARACVEAGWPPVELYACRLGHSLRVWPAELTRRRGARVFPPCGVCGEPMQGYVGNQRAHKGACRKFVARERERYYRTGATEPFQIERMSWYRGILAVSDPVSALDPLQGRMPWCWAQGWRRSFGL